jgi:hypothetical protein
MNDANYLLDEALTVNQKKTRNSRFYNVDLFST